MPVTSPRSGTRAYEPPPFTDAPDHRMLAQNVDIATQAILDGKSNATGSVTLTANQTTTVVNDRRCTPEAHIDLAPLTANAAAEAWYISARTEDQFTITHANAATVDRNFTYAIRTP